MGIKILMKSSQNSFLAIWRISINTVYSLRKNVVTSPKNGKKNLSSEVAYKFKKFNNFLLINT